ncbi:MAG: S1 RNA-binding domain-containing protein [Ardenticatenaceae bacterium]|nr:S1 RNA-binding domain-containing protein [Anaerolineales bacterium]MCB8941574.1 S1 RNA-binding domain-containing protein [Ardenticatenaceae bacterium]MCB8974532.1 S1 RNA-binding domain-containing protein [Ardenticatenaceae bacterium]
MSEETTETMESAAPEVTPTSINDLKPKMQLKGTVNRLELYGAFIDLGIGTNALIHISQLGKEHVNRVADVLNVGDEVSVWVDKVDPQREQIMVTMIAPLDVEWNELDKGQVYAGSVKRLENFGAFIDIGAEREGLVHISELSHNYVKHPSEVLTVGDEVQVQVLGFSKRKRRIDLSIKNLLEKPESAVNEASPAEVYEFEEEIEEEMPTAMEFALRQAMGEDMPVRIKKQGGKKRRKQSKNRNQQEDILSRTLQVQHNG